jgi:hypothetical protein
LISGSTCLASALRLISRAPNVSPHLGLRNVALRF